jgi:hypothetical protein
MKAEIKQQVEHWIMRGELGKAIELLLEKGELPADRREEVMAISGRYQRLLKGKVTGIFRFQEDSITENQISESLLSVLRYPEGQAYPEEQTVNQRIPQRVLWWKAITSIGIVVGLVAALTTILVNFPRIFGAPEVKSYSLTVLAHGPKGTDDIVLPNRGIITLVYGNAVVSEQINNQGEAVFAELPERFFATDAKVKIQFADALKEPYRAIYPDSLYSLSNGDHIDLAVKLFNLDKLKGIVRDFVTGDPMDSVRVSIDGLSTYSNAFGEFRFVIPDSLQRQFQTIRAQREGYGFYELHDVPVQTEAEVVIVMKPKG